MKGGKSKSSSLPQPDAGSTFNSDDGINGNNMMNNLNNGTDGVAALANSDKSAVG